MAYKCAMPCVSEFGARSLVRGTGKWLILSFAAAGLLNPARACGADLTAAQQQLLSGRYLDCIVSAQQALSENRRSEEWRLLLVQGLLAVGRYPDAYEVITNALTRDTRSIRLRWLAREALQHNGNPQAAEAMLQEIGELISARPSGYR